MIERRLEGLWQDLQGKKTASTALSVGNPFGWDSWT